MLVKFKNTLLKLVVKINSSGIPNTWNLMNNLYEKY